MDEMLEFLYSRERSEDERQERGGSEESCLTVPVWLNKVRRLFPRQAAEVLERHALERYRLSELLTDREVLEKLEPNQALLGTLAEPAPLAQRQRPRRRPPDCEAGGG
ncbi:MAG: hypothetical protein ACLU9S_21555 [Oscillospiraceae bacterium]